MDRGKRDNSKISKNVEIVATSEFHSRASIHYVVALVWPKRARESRQRRGAEYFQGVSFLHI